jgi:hypothetical protein
VSTLHWTMKKCDYKLADDIPDEWDNGCSSPLGDTDEGQILEYLRRRPDGGSLMDRVQEWRQSVTPDESDRWTREKWKRPTSLAMSTTEDDDDMPQCPAQPQTTWKRPTSMATSMTEDDNPPPHAPLKVVMTGLLDLCDPSTEEDSSWSDEDFKPRPEVTQVETGKGAPLQEVRGKLRATTLDDLSPTLSESGKEVRFVLSIHDEILELTKMQPSRYDLQEEGIISMESMKLDRVNIPTKRLVPSDVANPLPAENKDLSSKCARRRYRPGTRGVRPMARGLGKRM